MQSKLSSWIEISIGTLITISITLGLESLPVEPPLGNSAIIVGSLILSTISKYIIRRLFNRS